ncbi:putative T7SS-secreted protein [Streptomyces altiplanensis]
MFIEDDSAWPGVQFNPAKGDLEAIQLLAKDVDAVGKELDELDHLLKTVGDAGSFWTGDAADRFSKKLGELPKYLKQGTDSMQACAKALKTWHGQLEGFQTNAERIEAEAVTARKSAELYTGQYNQLVAKYQGQIFPEEQLKQINEALDSARSDADQANEKLSGLIREAERIHAQWKDRAGDAERAILKASENHPPDLSMWGKITDGLKKSWRDFKDWLVEHADDLSTWSAGLGVAALAVNAIPVVGQVASVVLASAAAVCAAGAMAGHWMGNARGNGTPGWKIGLDALGVLPGVGGLAKGATAAWKAAAGAGVISKVGSAAKGLASGATARGVYEGLENPLSMKGINWALKKSFNTELPALPTQIVIKGASTINGLLNGGDSGSSTQAPSAPQSSTFRHTLAA